MMMCQEQPISGELGLVNLLQLSLRDMESFYRQKGCAR